ncbi:ImmA/IrrE family metallo-endopeptidase [Alteribacillus sp. YIM 98480]|uniref:ImmA/IrrE family metallo-endopeptidase n=1 Tax=Alteribacillus sp. YIM 98480 TaxID=2606599 RepID=UPI00131B0FA9|nr:ImmA/IrrE family metallo-endopeptidase [Alteribacillus sp. YIM 98480]
MCVYSHLEDYINCLYQQLNLYYPEQLDIEYIANRLNIFLEYSTSSSFSFGNVLVLKRSNTQREWQDFGHEICHVLRHAGNHTNLPQPFIDYQEWQADHFARHFCVPTFMLQDIKLPKIFNHSVCYISNLFNVEHDFALKRLEHFYSQKFNNYMIMGRG